MGLKKRGLGRGLESLLTDVWIKIDSGDSQQQSASDDATGYTRASEEEALLARLQRERLALLREAEALQHLLEEFSG